MFGGLGTPDLAAPDGPMYLRAAVLVWIEHIWPTAYLADRSSVDRTLERARERGEQVPDLLDVFDVLIAPVGRPRDVRGPAPPGRVDALVDRFFSLPPVSEPRRAPPRPRRG